ncbi:MAG TPA: exodeoxyribonuclease VII large subunit [Candidatus Merdenecus merdavium]|nr:exodeoxyribonuclease VII large subunit [Candidatus Merdenecus merdavium]
MERVYSVSQVNSYIKNMFTQDFLLSKISVSGEVSNCKYHTSGHIYFSLKDQHGAITCVMFAGQRKGLAFPMKDGQRVVIHGNVNVYERDGRYQLYAKEIRLEGRGLLYEKFEALKKELEEMGMFAREYKQPIPNHIKTLGIVTASTGAAIQDIINISYRRNPYIQLILYPALVQGEGAAASIVKGIKTLDEYGVDTMIVGRGGGSIEDLWAFNEEIVARAIFDCKTPIISAVGHETDTTIADFVSDLRAPTPSAAAELAVDDFRAFLDRMDEYNRRMKVSLSNKIEFYKNLYDRYEMKIKFLSPENMIREKRQYLMDREDQLERLMTQSIQKSRHQLQIYIEKIEGLSPLTKLNQGYSFVSDDSGKAITDIESVSVGSTIHVALSNGNLETTVNSKEKVKRFD